MLGQYELPIPGTPFRSCGCKPPFDDERITIVSVTIGNEVTVTFSAPDGVRTAAWPEFTGRYVPDPEPV